MQFFQIHIPKNQTEVKFNFYLPRQLTDEESYFPNNIVPTSFYKLISPILDRLKNIFGKFVIFHGFTARHWKTSRAR